MPGVLTRRLGREGPQGTCMDLYIGRVKQQAKAMAPPQGEKKHTEALTFCIGSLNCCCIPMFGQRIAHQGDTF